MVNHKKDEAATLQAMLQERDREVEGMRKVCVWGGGGVREDAPCT
jgi:hypothetical protein